MLYLCNIKKENKVLTNKKIKIMKKQAIHNGMFGIITNIDFVKRTAMFSKFGKYIPYLVHLNEIQICNGL